MVEGGFEFFLGEGVDFVPSTLILVSLSFLKGVPWQKVKSVWKK